MTITFFPGEAADIYLYTKNSDGEILAVDSIDQLEILTPDRKVLETITTGFTNPATGTYKYVYNMPATAQDPYIIARWKYTHGDVTAYEEIRANIKGA